MDKEDSLSGRQELKETSGGGCSEKALCVLVHSLWLSAELYEPLRNTQRSRSQAA
jgi:hypothetical protein